MSAEWAGEQEFGESPFTGAEFTGPPDRGEALGAERNEWEQTEAPSWSAFPFGGTEVAAGQEWTGEWQTPAAGEWENAGDREWAGELTGESDRLGEALEGPFDGREAPTWAEAPFGEDETSTGQCGDQQYPGTPWTVDRPGRHATSTGVVHRDPRIDRAIVDESALSDFDVDDYRLRPAHHGELDRIAADVIAGVRTGRYLKGVRIRIRGETSSTATDQHNLALSRHRAFNVAGQLKCRIDQAGLPEGSVIVKWTPIGESVSQSVLGQGKEAEEYRRVRIEVVAPVSAACSCPTPSGSHATAPPVRRPARPRSRRPIAPSVPLCVSVPRIAPRQPGSAQSPPLARLVPGLPASAALLTHARATVQIENRTSHAAGRFEMHGWGLELALPVTAGADLRGTVHAVLDAIARGSATLSTALRVGPLGSSLRVDAGGFARALAQLVADARARLDIALRPNTPEPLACHRFRASAPLVRLEDFAGPALLVVPGRGLGPAMLHFASPAIARRQLRLSQNPVPTPADKSAVRTLLILGGALRHVGTGSTRHEHEDEFTASGELRDEYGETWEAPFGELTAETEATVFPSYAEV